MKKKRLEDLGMEEFEFNQEDVERIESITREFKDKSDDEIFMEIINLNEQMEKDLSYEEYEAIFEQIESIRHLLTEEQEAKLDRLLEQLGRK
ncbi:MAG: hypothetical protein GX185_02670 [Tissierellia bacterium]|mgnify:CR=1 FL=1|nr:hypothetical protein [Tissierellia bacterium]